METRNVQTQKIGIPPIPEHIFKNRVVNRQLPAQNVWGAQGTISYAPIDAKYIEGEGNFVYYIGTKYPSRTVAPVEAIYAMSGAKRLTITALKFLATLHKGGRITRLFQAFNSTALMMVGPYFLNDGYYCPVAKEVRKFIKNLLISFNVETLTADQTAEIMGMFFEYDNAYRIRIQDLANETSLIKLLDNFPKELDRLVKILASREKKVGGFSDVIGRFESGATVLKWIWRIPWTKKKLKNALLQVNLDNLKPDEADTYHALLFGDYNIQGKTIEERLEMYAQIHGKDQSKWPPRIVIMPPQTPQSPNIGENVLDFTRRITGKNEEEAIKLIQDGHLKDASGQVIKNPSLVFTEKGFA